MTDTFADLAALADLEPPDARYGRMLVRVGERWSYPGCPTDGTNMIVPRSSVAGIRVLAAVAAGVWAPFEIDGVGAPAKVISTDSPFWGRPPLNPNEVGTARAEPPVFVRVNFWKPSRLSLDQPDGTFGGVWYAGWQQGVVSAPAGAGLDHGLLELRIVEDPNGVFGNVAIGDAVRMDGGLRYVVEAINATTRDIALAHYIAPNG